MSGRDRNEPCPCGSGKKYKKCCLPKNESAPRWAPEDEQALRNWLTELPEADEFSALLYEELPEDLFDREVAGPIADAWLTAYMVCDVIGDPSHEHHADLKALVDDHEFGPGVQAYLTAASTLVPRPYKIVEIHRGHGATLVDLLTEESVRVYHPPFGHTDFLAETLVARILPRGPSGQPEPLLPWMPFPRPEDDETVWFIDELLEDLRIAREMTPELTDAAWLRQQPASLFRAWYQTLYGVPVEDLKTPDGHTVEDIDVVFQIADADALRATLAASPDFGAAGEDWEWRQPVPGSGDARTALAWLRIDGDRLLVQCIARAHAERLQTELVALAGAGLTFIEMVGADEPGDEVDGEDEAGDDEG